MITNPAGTLLFVIRSKCGRDLIYQIAAGGALNPGRQLSDLPSLSTGKHGDRWPGKLSYMLQRSALIPAPKSRRLQHQQLYRRAYRSSRQSLFLRHVRHGASPGRAIGPVPDWTTDKQRLADDDHLYVFSIAQTGRECWSHHARYRFAIIPDWLSPFSIAVQSNTGGNLVYSFSINDTLPASTQSKAMRSSTPERLPPIADLLSAALSMGAWGQFDQSGAFLLLWQLYDTTQPLIMQLSPVDVGTGGALTQPITTLTLATPGTGR